MEPKIALVIFRIGRQDGPGQSPRSLQDDPYYHDSIIFASRTDGCGANTKNILMNYLGAILRSYLGCAALFPIKIFWVCEKPAKLPAQLGCEDQHDDIKVIRRDQLPLAQPSSAQKPAKLPSQLSGEDHHDDNKAILRRSAVTSLAKLGSEASQAPSSALK